MCQSANQKISVPNRFKKCQNRGIWHPRCQIGSPGSRVNRKHCCHPGHPFRALSTCHNLKPEQPELLRREGYGVESSDIWLLGATFAVMFSESFVWFDTPDDGKDERLELLKRLKAGKSPNCLRKLPEPLRKALHGCFNINMQLRPCLQLLQEQLLSAKTST